MNSIKKKTLGPVPNFVFFGHSTETSTGIIQTEDDVNNFIHTYKFVNLFPTKIYQNYFREETDNNQGNLEHVQSCRCQINRI
jgi:hypothetical protein